MPSYRVYKLANNQFAGVSQIAAYDSDDEVVRYAKSVLDGLDVEVWDGPRMVIRLKSSEK
jgi:hypothetical protein